MRAGFNRDCIVDDVALNAGCGRQADFQAAHCANDAAIDHNVVSHAFAVYGGAFANRQKVRADIAIDGAFNLDVAGCLQVACDVQVRR